MTTKQKLALWTWKNWDTKKDEIQALYKRSGFKVFLIPTDSGDSIITHDGKDMYMVGVIKQ